MAPIDDALAEVYSYEPGEKISFERIAKKHGVVRSTLRRRHLGLHESRESKAIKQRMIIPQQEEELVKYIEGLIERRLPPKRGLIKSFASVIAKRPVSDSWVSRFIKRNNDRVTPQWAMGMDTERYSSQEKLKREKEAKEKRAKEKAAKEKVAKEKKAKEKEAKEKEAKEKRAREKKFREEKAKEKRAKEKEAKEKKAKEKKAKEKKAKEKEVKAMKAKATKVKDKEAKEKEAKKEAKKVKATRAGQAVGRARQQGAQKRSHDTENALKLPHNGKRKASQPSTQESKRQKRVDAGSDANAAEKLSTSPALTTRRGRNVRLPSRYK